MAIFTCVISKGSGNYFYIILLSLLRDCANVANRAKYFHSTSQYFLDTVETEAVISNLKLNY